jgi:predicted Ser/Thr protein kinase
MFKSFVEDEKLHVKRLRALLSAPNEKSQKKGKGHSEAEGKVNHNFSGDGRRIEKEG